MKDRIIRHQDLLVYKKAFDLAMEVFVISKSFPKDERYSLIDQMRRSSRSVCANLAEAWRKRRYEAAFINKLSDSEAEAAETQTWIEFAVHCKYLNSEVGRTLFRNYDEVISLIVSMINKSKMWTLSTGKNNKH